jgi:hypothetical protein
MHDWCRQERITYSRPVPPTISNYDSELTAVSNDHDHAGPIACWPYARLPGGQHAPQVPLPAGNTLIKNFVQQLLTATARLRA